MSGLRGREVKSRAARIGRSQLNSIKKAEVAASADSAHQLAAAIAGLGHGSSDEDDEVLEGYDSDEDPGLQERVLGSLPDQVAQIDVADIVDQLGERSMATRIQAARKLAAFLRAGPPASSLSSHIETLEQHIAANLKRGLPEEVPDVCDVLSVLAYAFGEEDGDFLLAGFLDGLINIASNWSQPNEPRVAALGAVGSLLLVLGSEEQTEAGLLLCESIFVQAHGAKKGIVVPMKDRCPTLLVQALRAWGVLASSLRTSRLAGAVTARYLGVMGDLLDHDNSGVRLEAGQNLALLHEAVSEGEEPDFSPLAGGSLDEDAGLQQQASGGSGKRPSFRPFLERLQELAEGFDRQQAKQARREQRAGFRAILKSLEGRADAEGARQMQPTESLALGKVRIVITGWREIRRYDFVRSALAGGFLVHLRGGCGIVPDLLDLDPEELQLEVSGAGEQASWDAKAARQERFRRADKEVQQAREKDRRKKQQLQQQGLFAGSDE